MDYYPKLKGNAEQKMCGAKKRFSTRELAVEEVNKAFKKHNQVLHPYQCPYCHYWHNGRHRSDE